MEKSTAGLENLLASTRENSYSWKPAKELHLELEFTIEEQQQTVKIAGKSSNLQSSADVQINVPVKTR